MPDHISLSEAVDSIHGLAEHRRMSDEAIGYFFDMLLQGRSSHQHLFPHKSREDIRTLSQERRAENDRLASLALLTFMEAVFMADYYRRVRKKERSPLGKAFRNLGRKCDVNKKRGKGKTNPSFEYDILELWKEYKPEAKREISYLKKIFKYRHWLAHGRRYLFQWEWDKYDFLEIYTLAEALLEHFEC